MAVSGILFVGLVVFAWKCAKRHHLRKIKRRWQNAYLMVNAHLATKKLRAEAEVRAPLYCIDGTKTTAVGLGRLGCQKSCTCTTVQPLWFILPAACCIGEAG